MSQAALYDSAGAFLIDALALLAEARQNVVIPTHTYARSITQLAANSRRIDIGHEPDLKLMPKEFYWDCALLPSFDALVSAIRMHPNSTSILIDAGGNALPEASTSAWILGGYLIPFVNDYVGTDFNTTFEGARFERVYARPSSVIG